MNYLPFAVDVIVLSEVKLKPTVNLGIYQLKGYELHACLRNSHNSKGGLLVYVREFLDHQVESASTTFETATISLTINSCKTHIIACYRPPEPSNLNEFLMAIEASIFKCRQNIILVGDINIDKNSATRESQKYFNLLTQYGLDIINTHVTRPVSGKIIDHVVTDILPSDVINHTIRQDSVSSDHNIIITSLNICNKKPLRHEIITKSKVNFEGLAEAFQLSIDNVSDKNDPNIIAEMITVATQKAIESCTTIYHFRIKNADQLSPWVNVELLEMMKKKDNLHTKYQQNPHSLQKKENYLRVCMSFRALNNKLRNKYFKNNFLSDEPKVWWRNINELNGRNKKSKEIKAILVDNQEITEIKRIANKFNNFFTTLPGHDNLAKSNVKSKKSTTSSIFLHPVDNEEVSAIIKKLKPSASAGFDGISPRVVKRLRYDLVPIFVHLINQIFLSGIYPDIFKIATVVPLHKSGCDKELNNYRPISILTVFNKIVERLIHNRLSSFLKKNRILHERQFGFRRKSGTESAAVDVLNFLQSELNKGRKVSAIFIDLQKAFDSVYHDTLLHILHDIGVRGKCHELINSYLKNRSQVVKINEIKSDPLPVTRGVIQGSIIGPLLFLIIINELASLPTNGRMILYADDGVLLQPHERHSSIETPIIDDMSKVLQFLYDRKLTINSSKTVFMVFHSPFKSPVVPITIKINNSFLLSKVDTFKYLGLWLDSSLNFESHCRHVERKIIPAVYSLWKLQRVIPQKQRLAMFNALIMSYLQYLITCWGTATHKAIEQLQVLQNRGLRNVYKHEPLSNREEMYRSHEILPLRALCYFRTAIFVHSTIHNFIHTPIKFEICNERRRSQFINPTKSFNNYGIKCIMCMGPRMFNLLPNDIKLCLKQTEFKKKLTAYLISPNNLPKFFQKRFLEITSLYTGS